ncbi:hypothetical protein CH259_01550 [Rhodococcus sp. 05-2254-4]|nr:hypothetical protein CH259_01550 [Rhodococcus sp. 05-2254-4]OZE49967.1 hypothetical protein CH261_05770 [Rhodococcus sp. 05-2254-3]OZE50605.1 hypothetical protein CH283_13075 [Rhodococcus sp. 05-2254-2]
MGLVGLGDATERLSTVHAVDESRTLHPTIDGSCVGRYYRSTKNRRRPTDVISMVDVSAAIEPQGLRYRKPGCVRLHPGNAAGDLTSRRRLLIENLGYLNSQAGIDMTNVRTTNFREYECVGPLSSWEIETSVNPDDV